MLTDKEIVASLVAFVASFVGVIAGFMLGLPSTDRILLGAGLGILGYLHTRN